MSKDSFNLILLAFANIKQIFESSNHYHIKIIIIELYFNFAKFIISNQENYSVRLTFSIQIRKLKLALY